MNIKILVAAHKNYSMPKDSELYVPIFVGKGLHKNKNSKIKFKGDDTGENISQKNSSYNELTALYWGWKNLSADVLGLVHYRRYLSLHRGKSIDKILTKSEIEKILTNFDVIVPKKRHYYIETNYSHYVHAHPKEELNITRSVISNKFPEYLKDYDLVMDSKSAHMFNMFVMRKDLLDSYCSWLFSILNSVESVLDTTSYDAYQSRVFGFISERLLDVWLKKNGISYKEVNVTYLESQHWVKKIFVFLKRKFISR